MSVLKDLTGQRFGKLVVLRRAENGRRGESQWYCKCDCGGEKIATNHALTSGKTTTCGCGNYKDLTGMQFGELTAIKFIKTDGHYKHKWLCKCSCGDTCLVPSRTLLRGRRTKCDNHIQNLMIGQTFDKLTVLEYTKTENHKAYYLCQCSCGNIIEVRGNNLRTGITSSCGCKCSVGENNIKFLFDANNICYKTQHTFESCHYPDTNKLGRFDFYVEADNSIIEFDGKQHFGFKNMGWDNENNYITTHNHDLFKNKWAWENNIKMKRIPYTERDTLTIHRLMSDEFLISPSTHPQWYPDQNAEYPYVIKNKGGRLN